MEHVTAVADNEKGEETAVLLTGELTVTPASAGTEKVRPAEQARVTNRIFFIGRFL